MPANLQRIVDSYHSGEEIILAVTVSRTATGTHAGIAYRSENGTYRLLHFAWHHDLKEGGFDFTRSGSVCVIPSLLRPDAVALAGYCRRIVRLNVGRGTIPYNLRYDEGTGFDPETGDLILPATATGMSCGTFVLHVFRSSGNRILDATGWPPARPEDLDQQRRFIQMLRDEGYGDHANRLEVEDLGCPRIRPEEVAGACLEDGLADQPATFRQCEPNGRLLLAVADSWNA